MEVETAQPSSGSGSSSAAYPRWVTLDRYCVSSAVVLFPKTLAAARTSNGHPIQVSLSLVEPPAMSIVCVKFSHGVHLNYSIVMAAHGDSLLLVVSFRQGYHGTLDYFVYNAGDAAADPPRKPSLLLLPRYYLSESEDNRRRYERYYYYHRRYLDRTRYPVPVWDSDPLNPELETDCTGIICPRRGEDKVVVVKLKMVVVSKGNGTENTKAAELLLFRSGAWSVKRPWVCCGNDDEFGELHSEWETSSVFPVGDRILCWVDDTSDGGVLICDVLEESPCLQYVPLPTVPTACFGRKVCITTGGGGGGTIKFVNIFPRCCCGGAGASNCRHSHHAYTINTWTLRTMDDGMRMEWVMDGMVDATELWSLDAYDGLPRVPLRFPVVSMYDSNVMCFALCESRYHVKHGGDNDKTLWLLMVNMRSKTIQSVSCYPDWLLPGPALMSSNVSCYLNPYPTCTCSSDGTGTATDQSQMDIEKKKRDDGDNGTNSMLPSPCMSATSRTEPAAQASEILAAFQEIPSYGLARDDMLKAYAILSGNNGCRVRSLLTLPMKLRKDWLLMEIKAAEA